MQMDWHGRGPEGEREREKESAGSKYKENVTFLLRNFNHPPASRQRVLIDGGNCRRFQASHHSSCSGYTTIDWTTRS